MQATYARVKPINIVNVPKSLLRINSFDRPSVLKTSYNEINNTRTRVFCYDDSNFLLCSITHLNELERFTLIEGVIYNNIIHVCRYRSIYVENDNVISYLHEDEIVKTLPFLI